MQGTVDGRERRPPTLRPRPRTPWTDDGEGVTGKGPCAASAAALTMGLRDVGS